MDDRIKALLDRLHTAPAANSKNEAWDIVSEIIGDMNIKNRYDEIWTIPTLESENSSSYGDGGVAIMLLGHCVLFNSSGAYRIVEISDRYVPVFDKRAADGSAFRVDPTHKFSRETD